MHQAAGSLPLLQLQIFQRKAGGLSSFLQSQGSLVRIPPGCKVFREIKATVLRKIAFVCSGQVVSSPHATEDTEASFLKLA
jgi:hypothetical protein